MAVTLKKALVDTHGLDRKGKLRVMKARQSALSLTTLGLLEERGYRAGQSLKIPGGFAFQVTKDGKPKKIGIKTSADRWVGIPRDSAGTWGILSAVDEVFIVTFDDRFAPTRLQVIAFDPKDLISMGVEVYAAAKKAGQTGIQWIPLDKHEGRSGTSMTAGHLLPHGEMIIDERIEWTADADDADSRKVSVQNISKKIVPPLQKLTIEEAKIALAATYEVNPDSIKIIIEW